MTEPTRFPLCWPDTMPRKQGSRDAGQFKTALGPALKNVETALKLFGQDSGKPVRDAVISSNVTLGHANPTDPGVAVWFTWEDQSICIPVDRYSKVEANLQAIYHVLEARRVELRHGTLALVRATMKGFQALPAPKSWREVLGVEHSGPLDADELSRRYRRAAQLAAPNSDKLTEINMARDRAKQELGL